MMLLVITASLMSHVGLMAGIGVQMRIRGLTSATGFLDFFIELPSVYLFDDEIKSKSALQITRNLVVMW